MTQGTLAALARAALSLLRCEVQRRVAILVALVSGLAPIVDTLRHAAQVAPLSRNCARRAVENASMSGHITTPGGAALPTEPDARRRHTLPQPTQQSESRHKNATTCSESRRRPRSHSRTPYSHPPHMVLARARSHRLRRVHTAADTTGPTPRVSALIDRPQPARPQ